MTRPALKELGIQSFSYSLLLTGKQLCKSCVISSFRCGVKEIFALLGCYAAYTGSYGRFGTTYRSHHWTCFTAWFTLWVIFNLPTGESLASVASEK